MTLGISACLICLLYYQPNKLADTSHERLFVTIDTSLSAIYDEYARDATYSESSQKTRVYATVALPAHSVIAYLH